MITNQFLTVRSLLLCILLCAFSIGLNAQITVNVSNKTVKDVIDIIEKQEVYNFFYSDKLPSLDKKVSIKAKNESVESVLNKLFKDSNITYKIEPDKQIVLSEKKDQQATPTKPITGQVKDATGSPLIGVTVSIEDAQVATMTDIDGNYRLNAAVGSTLNFTYVGFQKTNVRVGTANNYDIELREDDKLLEEVVVIGYGSMKRKDITTAVSTISTEDIDKRPVINAGQALQGKGAGIQVIQPSGAPGGGLSIRVRGATSVQASNDPLYVVDGMPMDDISFISPTDIQDMQVLKDASSAAIYGARAANGVVLITTKRGSEGKAVVKLNTYAGFSKLGKKINSLNTEEYKDLMREMKKYTNTVPTIPEDEHRYTDWTDKFFGTGVDQNYQLSVASGSKNIKYLVSAGYTDQQGIVKKAQFDRYNFRANVDSKQTSWLDMALNFSYSKTKGQWVGEGSSSMRGGSILSVINTPPFMQEWSSTPGKEGQYDEDAYGMRIPNPLAINAPDNITSTDYLTGSFGLTFDIYKGLKLKTTFGLNMRHENWSYYLDPLTTQDGRGTKGKAQESFKRNEEWLLENILTYDLSVKNHNFSFMGGATQQHANERTLGAAGFDMLSSYPNLHSISNANQIDISSVGANNASFRIASFLGRVAYNYDGKYLFTANFRTDGSSRFAPGHRWGYFPSLSAGWRISDESFMKATKEYVDDMKLRVGWGMNGNQGGIGNYAYLGRMSASRVPPTADNPYPGMALSPYTGANTELTWEKTTQWNVGLDLALLNSRLNIAIDAYYKKTTDLLFTIQLPKHINLPGGITRNDGGMTNKGLEFSVSSDNIRGEFSWTTDFNISFNRNKLSQIGITPVYYYAEMYETKEMAVILKEGIPLGSFYGYISEGVDPETGNIIYRDLDGDGKIDADKDRTIIGCAEPDFIYGLTNTFSYKGFGLSVFLQGSQGNDIFNASKIDMEGMQDFRNQSKQVLNRWQRPGMITDIPRAANKENIHNSSRFVEDGSYLRIKNITLSYDFKSEWLRKIHLSKLQVYATAQNLVTFTNYKGYDPEVNTFTSNAASQGIDYGTYPQSKAIIFGLNVEF